jgi:hypothetical protein
MVKAELIFSTGTLRQPGIWGKILQPPSGGIFYIPMTPSDDVIIKKDATTLIFPKHPEGLLFVFGINGYHAAGTLVNIYIALRKMPGGACDIQFPGHLTRIAGKELSLLAKSENDLTPIYEALKQANYQKVQEFQDMLRKEGRDKSTA